MENHIGNTVSCEEKLRTTLHCDDKEKLRRKLMLLQREYLRTAQRLQRAERSEAVRRHVRSRITQENRQYQRNTSNPGLNPSSLKLDTQDGTGEPQSQGPAADPADSETPKKSQVIRFLLQSDAACPQTPDPSCDSGGEHRPGPALRLRSRRSRMRWEQRNTESGRSTDNSEEGREESETAGTEGVEERVETDGADVVNGSEELFSGSESPSLLLTHWNTCAQTETGDMAGNDVQEGEEKRERETQFRDEEEEPPSLLLSCGSHTTHTEGREHNSAENVRKKETEGEEEGDKSRGQRDGRLCEDGIDKNTEHNTAESTEGGKGHDKVIETKEEKSEMAGGEHDVKGGSLLDSCTLVDGLIFPAEYYVRTTRRMTLSQSQPDMQAVILTQLSRGRHRRSRGRGLKKHTDGLERSEIHSPLTSASRSSRLGSQAADAADLDRQSSGDISDQISSCQVDTDVCFSPAVASTRARGRKRRRGRGRGRPQTPRHPLDTPRLELGRTLDDSLLSSCPISSSLSPRGADEPKCIPGEIILVPDDPQPASTHSKATHPPSGDNGAQSGPASGHQDKVYPIFLKSSSGTNKPSQMNRDAANWKSLLLPSSPPAQTSLPPRRSPLSVPLVSSLMKFDIPQDFHLPDDQFASLKLHKLRQVAMESGVEHMNSPSYNTRRSIKRFDTSYSSSSDALVPLSLPLSVTPTITKSPCSAEEKQAASQSVDLQNFPLEHEFTDKLTSCSLPEDSSDRDVTEIHEDLQPESRTQTTSAECGSVVQDRAADCVDQYTDIRDTVTLNADITGKVNMKESHFSSSEEQAGRPGVVHPVVDQRSLNHQTEEKVITESSFDLLKTPEEPTKTCIAAQACNDDVSPVQHLNVKSPVKDSKESCEPATNPLRDQDMCRRQHSVHSQLLMSPPPTLAPCSFVTSHLPSSALSSSPTLPSLGLTPHRVPATLRLTSSPSAPALTLPPPHSPSTQVLSPPALSPCPSLPSLPSSQPPTSPTGQITPSTGLLQGTGPATGPTVSSIQSQVSLRAEEAVEDHMMGRTQRLKAPAGGCLVDACCLSGSSGGLYVAAAGKWAVCLWSLTPASDWSLIHTWTFDELVISVFPVPDAAGLLCVTLGQLEIREVRMLSCSSPLQVLLCGGVVQAAVGVPESRVVTSSHSASGSALQVFTLSDAGSTPSSEPLVSPGVCVGALAPVDRQLDALIGTDDGGRLFIWNLKTGQLLRKILLGDGLSHTSCLRGYSCCGVLFVLLQHQLLSSLEEEEEATEKYQMEEEEKKKPALFSLVAVNPLSGKSVQAARLCPPDAWSGRLCEADVIGSSVVGLSQSGCVCVWELKRRGASRMVWAPESEGWQLARWGEGGMLVTGHQNGDVSLHYNTPSHSAGNVKD